MTARRFSRETLPMTPWKNGGGSTREIICWPEGAALDGFGWRVSIATIASDGPFSVFAGIERSIMLLDGDGVRLQSADGTVSHSLDEPWQPFAFSGDAAIDCTLLGGASSDFNVMTRRGAWRAEVSVLRAAAQVPAAPHGVLLAMRGDWRLDADGQRLNAGEGLCWAGEAHGWQAVPAQADAALVAVRVVPAMER